PNVPYASDTTLLALDGTVKNDVNKKGTVAFWYKLGNTQDFQMLLSADVLPRDASTMCGARQPARRKN
ncbi:unnamed protein product, partial [Amoebophrya sp. A25]